MLKILRIYIYFIDYVNTFQIKNKNHGSSKLIIFQKGQIYPRPH